MAENQAILEKLKQIPIFEEISSKEEFLRELMGICKVKSARKGETVIKEGDVGDEMYIVYSGAVEIKKRTRAGDEYTVVRLRSEHNVFFGELALIDDDKRSASVRATEDSEFLVITKGDFVKLGDNYPSIGLPVTRAISKILASRLRKTTADMLTLFDALVNELQS
ncbi:MAG: cyclic nucleotide-binding domain-containing protein [Alkalispirochaetaceae bacterium]